MRNAGCQLTYGSQLAGLDDLLAHQLALVALSRQADDDAPREVVGRSHDGQRAEQDDPQDDVAGREDPLFGDLPDAFMAQLGRKDRAADHLPNAPTLSTSQRAPVQAIRVPGQPVWASQFHPELDRVTNLGRYARYLDGYRSVIDDEQHEEVLAGFQESPHTMDLLERFLRLVFA